MMMIMAMMTTGLVVLLSCCAYLTYLLTTWTRFPSVQIQNTTEALTTTAALLWERRPDQNKKGGKNQQQLWHPFNGIDWTDSADSSNKKHIAPSLTRLGTFPHIHGCRRRRGGKKKKKTFPAAVKACCCCGCRCHFRPCFAYLAAWLSWVFSLCTKLSVSAFPWLNGNATAVAPLPSLKSEACSHCLHVTFKFCLCSFFVMALLFSNCGILNSMEDIADRSLLGWRIN